MKFCPEESRQPRRHFVSRDIKQSRSSYDLNTTASREILRHDLAALGALHGRGGIRADVRCTSSKSTSQKRETDASVTRECFEIFIFLENTQPDLETRGNWYGSPRFRPWHRYCLKSCAFFF